MSDLRARLAALVAEWQHIRQQLQEAPLDSAAERYYTNAQAWTYGRCAGEVAALLREPPEAVLSRSVQRRLAIQKGEPPEHSRLVHLAQHGARLSHAWYFDAAENIDEEPPAGHEQPFDTCPHPDCRLVRDAARAAAPLDNETWRLLTAALLALRSYQYGNASTELAREVADPIDAYLKARAAAPEEP